MKKVKLLGTAIVLTALFALSSCTEDAAFTEIVDSVELGEPSFKTGNGDTGDDKPST